MNRFYQLISFFLVFCLTPLTHGYTELGNGLGGIARAEGILEGPRYLLGADRVINVCVKNYPEHAISREDFSNILQSSFDFWKEHAPLEAAQKQTVSHRLNVFFEDCGFAFDLLIQIHKPHVFKDTLANPKKSLMSNVVAEVRDLNRVQVSPWRKAVLHIVGPDVDVLTSTQSFLAKKVRLNWLSARELSLVIHHEVGHIFGLSHGDSADIMDPMYLQTYLFDSGARDF